jgi:tetratricopeptide (TPR) repeat protein
MRAAASILLALGLVAGEVGFDEDAVDGALTEPSRKIEEGRRYLDEGRVEDAIEAFREADVEGGDRGAAIQFNVARALAEDAARSLEAAKKDAPAPQPGQPPAPAEIDPEILQRLQQAGEAFERAYELSKGGALRSQSAQAAGNAWVRAQDLPRAIEQYRRSLVADPKNEASRRNLARALRWMRASPPPPPSSGGDKDDDNEDEQDGDQEQQQQQQEQGEQEGQQQQQPQPQPQGEQQEQQEQQDQQDQLKDGEDKQEQQAGQEEDEKEPKQDPKQSPEQKNEQGKDQKGQQKTKAERDKEKARQILDAMRSRERPLDPQLMRDRADPPPRSGKDW